MVVERISQNLSLSAPSAFCLDASPQNMTEEKERNAYFHSLVENSWQRIYWTAFDILGNEAETEDICQEALLRAYEKWDTFRGEARAETWFFRILTNLCLNHHRRQSVWQRVRQWIQSEGKEEHWPMRIQSSENPEKSLLSRQSGEAIHSAMEKLSKQQRSIFVLRYLQDFSVREVAEITGLSENSVKTHTARALQTMRKNLSTSQSFL